jgi:hypothetical protein
MRRLAKLLLGALVGVAVAALAFKRARPSRGDEESDELDLVAIFNAIELESRAAAFAGGSIFAWFGVCVVDLRDAVPAPRMSLSVTALFGVVVITTPPGWRVEADSIPFGVVVVEAPEPESDDAPLLALTIRSAAGVVVVESAAVDAGDEDDEV